MLGQYKVTVPDYYFRTTTLLNPTDLDSNPALSYVALGNFLYLLQ